MKNTMMLISATHGGKPTFQLILTSKDCPYQEATFDPTKKNLLVIHPNTYESFNMLPRLSDEGNPMKGKVHESGYKHERVRIAKHFDYVIGIREEIQKFVDLATGETNDLEEYFKVEIVAPIEPAKDALLTVEKGQKKEETKEPVKE